MMDSKASAPAGSRLGSSRRSLETIAIGSRGRFGAEINSTGSSPDQAERAVRLAASGWRPLCHPGQCGLGDAGLFAHSLPGGVPGLHGGAESGIEGREIESGASGHVARLRDLRRRAGRVAPIIGVWVP